MAISSTRERWTRIEANFRGPPVEFVSTSQGQVWGSVLTFLERRGIILLACHNPELYDPLLRRSALQKVGVHRVVNGLTIVDLLVLR